MDGIIDNLINAINTWNAKLTELWAILTQSPQQFKGVSIWRIMVNIHSTLQGVGLALLVLFFVVGIKRGLQTGKTSNARNRH